MLHPILLDARPGYMGASGRGSSLLLAPVGARCLVSVLCDLIGTAGGAPSVLSVFPAEEDAEYGRALRRAHGRIARVRSLADFRPLEEFEAADWLLFVDARYCVLDASEIPSMLRDMSHSRSRSTHLVAMARHAGGTSERVELAHDGRVRRIQRYYDAATWPFMNAVACSLVPAASLRRMTTPLEWSSLTDLRLLLLLQGVPCRDVPLRAPCFDLTHEDDLLRLNQRVILDTFEQRRSEAPLQSENTRVHPEARLVGPIVLQESSTIDAGAVLIGPAVVGAGARIGSNVILAQAVVGPGVHVPADTVVRSRTLYGASPADPPRRRLPVEPLPAPIVTTAGTETPLYPRLKAAFDFVVAAVALALLSPLFLLIAVLIKLDSRGAVLYGDLREGRDGKLFRCLKFRTMATGSDVMQAELLKMNEVDGPQFKMEKDPRLTRLGRWLRPMSLDELPQLFNVLRGEMSLIGPRPSPFRENQTCVPWRDARLSVRPGITGLWQVCRQDRRGGDFHQWIYFDLLYVQHLSFTIDMRILVATILTRGGQTSVPAESIVPARKIA